MSLIEDLYRQNEWANLEVLELCRGLTEEQLGATLEGTYGSIAATLTHMIAAEAGYVVRLGGTYTGPRVPYDSFPGFDVLEAATRAATAGLIERAHAALAESYTVRETEGNASADVDAELMLGQALIHGADHRSQVCTILTTLGFEIPEIDAWGWGLATGRFREL
ncbi:MAG: DinB family protein [Dehalococcoidia bacterium]|nr:DinB family protein [Dehalococcoidia bacterium]